MINATSQGIRYLRDIDDRLVHTVDDLHELDERCDQLLAQYQQYKDTRLSKILFILTLTTVTCLPGQLLSGVYGMNFSFDGKSTVPLMEIRHGFIVWIIIVACFTCFILIALLSIMKLSKSRGTLRKPKSMKTPNPVNLDQSRYKDTMADLL
jgi:Mg2+ and Co2+ transporter CorA